MRLIIAARVELLPEPVGPVSSTKPFIGVETIYEGYLLHYGRARLFAPADGDVAQADPLGDLALVVEHLDDGLTVGADQQAQTRPALGIGQGQRRGDPHDLLRNLPYIQYDRTVAGGALAERYLRQQGIAPHRRLEINGLMSIAAMVDQGLGISLLPDWSALWDRGLAIAKVSLPKSAPIRRTGFIWAVRTPHEPMAQLFLKHAEEIWRPEKRRTRLSALT